MKLRRVPWLVLGLALPIALPLAACQRDHRPDLVLVTLGAVRADHALGAADTPARLPALGALAAQGTRFERAYSSVPLSLPAHATLLTGVEPGVHGIHDEGGVLATSGVTTLAERLHAAGYATGAVVGTTLLDRAFGLSRGFDRYDDAVPPPDDGLGFAPGRRPAAEVTARALDWLAARPKAPFFLWVELDDARGTAAEDAEGSESYDAALASMDGPLAKLLTGVKQAAGGREVLVLATADHGVGLVEHGEIDAGSLAYDSTLHVPLVAAGPGFPAGARSDALVCGADVAATLLAAAGIALPAATPALPLQPRVTDDSAGDPANERALPIENAAPALRYGWARLGGVRTARWKYLAEPPPAQLYDVAADPAEAQDQSGAQAAVVSQLQAVYGTLRPADPLQPPAPVPAALEEARSRLGFVPTPQVFQGGGAPDPRPLAQWISYLTRARAVVAAGRLADGIRALEILARQPVLRPMALWDLSISYTAAGRAADAAAALQALLAQTDSTAVRVMLAEALCRVGQPDQALEVLDAATGGADSVRALVARSRALLALDRGADALAAAMAALQHDPESDAARAAAGRARAAQEGAKAEIPRLQSFLGEHPEDAARWRETALALAELMRADGRALEAQRSLEQAPPSAERDALQGDLSDEAGDLPGAARHYEAAAQAQPAVAEHRRRLAGVYTRAGQLERALPLYEDLVEASPADPTLRVDRAVAELAAKQLDAAEKDLRQAKALDPKLPEAAYDLGYLALVRGNEAEAEREFLRAVALRPKYAKAHLQLARLYQKRGDPRAAAHAEQAAASLEAVPVDRPSGADTQPEAAGTP